MFDPSKLHEVKSRFIRKPEQFLIKFNADKKTFQLSDEFINNHKLSVNGLRYFLSEDNQVILSVQDEEHSAFYKKKENANSKTSSFKHEVLADELISKGIGSGPLSVKTLAVVDGVEYLEISGSFDIAPEEGDPEEAEEEEIEDEEEIEASASFDDELL